MSIESWKEEYYPLPAEELLVEPSSTTSAICAIKHSLHKWEGLRSDALAKHGLRVEQRGMFDIHSGKCLFTIDNSSCTLCLNFTCIECPLAITRGGVACDHRWNGPQTLNVWEVFIEKSDPEPMIVDLAYTLKRWQALAEEERIK